MSPETREKTPAAARETGAAAQTREPAGVLIVDDEFSVRDSLQSWFSKDGYRTGAAKDANEALELLRPHPNETMGVEQVPMNVKIPGNQEIRLPDTLLNRTADPARHP